MGRTIAELRVKALRLLDDNTSSPIHWSTAEIDEFLNKGMRDFARRTKCMEEVVTVSGVAHQSRYSVPSKTIDISRVLYNGDRWLKPKNSEWMDENYLTWLEDEGDPLYIIRNKTDGETDAYFRVSPIPETAGETGTYATGTLTAPVSGTDLIYDTELGNYVATANASAAFKATLDDPSNPPYQGYNFLVFYNYLPDVVASGVVPATEERWDEFLIDYAVSEALKEQKDVQNLQKSGLFYQQYIIGVNEAKTYYSRQIRDINMQLIPYWDD